MSDDKPAFTFVMYFSEVDNVPVVHVETPAEWDNFNSKGPCCRVYLNDGEIYENPPLPEPELAQSPTEGSE